MGDGGKWICGAASRLATKRDCVIYSFGVNTESSFEEELLSMTTHCEVWGYDFSVNGWGEQITPRNTHRVHFNKVGLGPKDKHDGKNQFYTLDTIMKQNGMSLFHPCSKVNLTHRPQTHRYPQSRH